MDADALRWALFNTYIFISPVGGSGGGIFRYMFSRFLREAAALTASTTAGCAWPRMRGPQEQT